MQQLDFEGGGGVCFRDNSGLYCSKSQQLFSVETKILRPLQFNDFESEC